MTAQSEQQDLVRLRETVEGYLELIEEVIASARQRTPADLARLTRQAAEIELLAQAVSETLAPRRVSGPRCVWCEEPLVYDKSRGWVHKGGSLYVSRCPCGWVGSIPGTGPCPGCGGSSLRDDHCALPQWER